MKKLRPKNVYKKYMTSQIHLESKQFSVNFIWFIQSSSYKNSANLSITLQTGIEEVLVVTNENCSSTESNAKVRGNPWSEIPALSRAGITLWLESSPRTLRISLQEEAQQANTTILSLPFGIILKNSHISMLVQGNKKTIIKKKEKQCKSGIRPHKDRSSPKSCTTQNIIPQMSFSISG